MKYGYYMLQESVYCCRFKEKSQAKKSIQNIKNYTPMVGNIRAIIITSNTFEEMEILLGETTIEEKILSKKNKIIEL